MRIIHQPATSGKRRTIAAILVLIVFGIGAYHQSTGVKEYTPIELGAMAILIVTSIILTISGKKDHHRV